MPIKKKTTAAKKPAVLGPKAKLMKLQVTTLRNKAKKLGISDVSKRTKENLVQSIILGEARKKRGTAAGKKATAKRAAAGVRQSSRQTGKTNLSRDIRKRALAPGRRVSASGRVYYERRANRSDKPGQLSGSELSRLGYREVGMLGEMLNAWADQNLSSLAKKYFGELTDWGFNPNSGFVYLTDEDDNVLMFNESMKKLDLFLSTPDEGQEGFIEDLLTEWHYLTKDDQDFVESYYRDLSSYEKARMPQWKPKA